MNACLHFGLSVEGTVNFLNLLNFLNFSDLNDRILAWKSQPPILLLECLAEETFAPPRSVCRRLRISPRTLQTLRDNGTLAFTKIGNRTYYRPDDVERVVGNVEDKRKEARWKGKTIWTSFKNNV